MTFDQEYKRANLYGDEPSSYLRCYVNRLTSKRGKALDIGCGTGRNAIFLAKEGFEVTAFDISSQGISRLKARAAREHVRLTALVSDAMSFAYQQNEHTFVVANTVLDHVSKKDGEILAGLIAETMCPGGYLFASVFTTSDPGFTKVMARSSTAKYVKHYFEPNALRETFRQLKIIRYHEELHLDESHGKPHYHSTARIFAQKA